ncbi:hypothetical protein QC762_0108930 [Podospora pseudocomata]|uniref:Uncharacterized protein n=1 Tax=Podospora pseudocomata TaxID=2093779 RepID=A0ABR0G3P9_9PEZI|nr:hypothetical protein QC762_0108930 [Podospora pseudocomata]
MGAVRSLQFINTFTDTPRRIGSLSQRLVAVFDLITLLPNLRSLVGRTWTLFPSFRAWLLTLTVPPRQRGKEENPRNDEQQPRLFGSS